MPEFLILHCTDGRALRLRLDEISAYCLCDNYRQVARVWIRGNHTFHEAEPEVVKQLDALLKPKHPKDFV